ncbi:DUF1292 domain-containing protein [Aeribacillus sp. FSL M8-0254]|uniref:DUF1292 domain-containing protein n=1 Tax=Aeribacillus sp. FSL M8-0254 TaxID=2954577 RepID=UPI0030F67F48
MEGEKHITVIDENGNEQLYEILFTFDSDEFDKSYVLYYPIGIDDEEDEEGIEIYAASYIPNEDGEGGKLEPVETDEEWEMIEAVLNTFLEEE